MRSYLRVSGALFVLIAVVHLLRLVYRAPAEVAEWMVPLWVSIIGFALPAGLALWAFRLARNVRPPV
jgi:hypothetical protein